MLTGKKFSQIYRALGLIKEELLRQVLQETGDINEFMIILEARACESRTTKVWLIMLIKPVFINDDVLQG